jgi:hypothetical protein
MIDTRLHIKIVGPQGRIVGPTIFDILGVCYKLTSAQAKVAA